MSIRIFGVSAILALAGRALNRLSSARRERKQGANSEIISRWEGEGGSVPAATVEVTPVGKPL